MMKIRQTSRAAIPVPSFSRSQLGEVANAAISAEEARISRAFNVQDQPAKPLSLAYAKAKVKRGGQPIRDLHLTGDMLNSRRAIEVGDNSVTVGFADQQQTAKAAINQSRDPMLGISPADKQEVDGVIRDLFGANIKRITAG